MTARSSHWPLHFEDIAEGQVFETLGLTITEDAIIQFALQWDFHPFHVDRTAASDSEFGGLIASGLHSLVVTYRLFNQLGPLVGTAIGIELNKLRWLRPLKAGDTIRTAFSISHRRESKSRPKFGIVGFGMRTTNQNEETVLLGELVCLVRKRG